MLATSASPDCIIDHSSYSINVTSSVVSMDSSGSLTIDTTSAMALTSFKASVVVGSQMVESPVFNVEILLDCNLYVSFPSLKAAYIGDKGSKFPDINAQASSNSPICVIDSDSYALNGSTDGVSLDKDGTFKVDAASILPLSTLKVSVVASN